MTRLSPTTHAGDVSLRSYLTTPQYPSIKHTQLTHVNITILVAVLLLVLLFLLIIPFVS